MESSDLIVIGGGISGLSLAHGARAKGLAVTLLERETRVGGALHSISTSDDFWFELGAHTAYNSYGRFMALAEELGLVENRVERMPAKWKVWEGDLRNGGRPVSVTSRLSWLQLAPRLPFLVTTKRAGRTVEGYFSRVVGAGNYRRVVGPMLGAVVSQDAGGFPADLLFKKRPRRKDWPRSFTLAGGLSTFTDALADHTAGGEGLTVHTGPEAGVEIVTRSGSGWQVTTGDERTFEARMLAFATPPDTAGFLLREAAPEVSKALRDFEVSELTTVGVVVAQDKTALPPMAGLVGLEAPFRSMVTRDPVPHATLRGFAFHFRPETTEAEQVAQIEAVLGCGPADWVHRTQVWRRLPTLAAGHTERIARLDGLLAGLQVEPSLLLTGNWFGGMAIEDCLTRSAEEIARISS